MINFIKKLIRIVNEYDQNNARQRGAINRVDFEAQKAKSIAKDAQSFVKSKMSVDADLGFYPDQRNTIIVTGVFKNKSYVEVFNLSHQEFKGIVEILRDMKKHHTIRHIDAPAAMKVMIDQQTK